LSEKYGWDLEPLKGIGYREWQKYLASGQSLSATAQSLSETEAKIVKSTRDLTKRQWTWLKRNPHIQWFGSADEAYAFLATQLA
jgi:tRNA A37 N6-isopentenylltransferase MiaA